jgi:hypothetical protein
MMIVGRCDLALVVHARTVNRNGDSKDGFLHGVTTGVRLLRCVPQVNSVRIL